MTENLELDPKKLTFSQAQGYEEIPRPLVLGELSDEARIRLWNLLVLESRGSFSPSTSGVWALHNGWRSILETLHSEFILNPMYEFPTGSFSHSNPFIDTYKPAILRDLSFNRVFDLFQMIMRHPRCPVDFTVEVAAMFRVCRLAYVVDIEQPVTILPAVTPQEGEAIIGAIKELRQVGLQGAETHLKKAGEHLNSGDWPDAVRDSINAVESVARQLDPDASKELEPALASLEKKGRLHPAMKQAFSRLYGYTSDEEGIRHALLTNATSPAGKDEAVFMLGACASFASYLWRRHQSGS